MKKMIMGVAFLVLGGLGSSARAGEVYRYVPSNAFQLRMGYFAPDGDGTLWEDVEQRFTLDSSDFDGVAWGMSFVGGLSPYWELGVSADWYQQTVRSAESHYIDTDGYAIVHDTTLRQFPLALDLRLVPGGRRPGKPVFYLGAGAGLNFWEYSEYGDFVDERDPDLPVYFAALYSSGTALEGRLLAGLEFPISPAFNLAFEGRYSFAETDVSGDLSGLGTIDLGGVWLFAGASFRF